MPYIIFFPKVKNATKKSDYLKTITFNKKKIALSNAKQTYLNLT